MHVCSILITFNRCPPRFDVSSEYLIVNVVHWLSQLIFFYFFSHIRKIDENLNASRRRRRSLLRSNFMFELIESLRFGAHKDLF